MSFVKTQCGGLKINDASMKLINGVVTDYNANAITAPIMAKCGGQMFDSAYFAIVDGAVALADATQVTTTVTANCSLLFDSISFALDDDGAIEYNPDIMGLLTITTSPADAIVLVTDSNDMVVTESAEGVYPVMIGKTYTYTVSATGYATQTADIEIADAVEEVDVTLVANP